MSRIGEAGTGQAGEVQRGGEAGRVWESGSLAQEAPLFLWSFIS